MASSPSSQKFACKSLVLDAGPLLSLSPLRGLAETFYTVPQVLSELKDKNARAHFERLGLNAGVKIQVQSPDSTSLAHVIQCAKKTGDYSVLSHADVCVLALTYALDKREKEAEVKDSSSIPETNTPVVAEGSSVAPGVVGEPPSVEPNTVDGVDAADADQVTSDAEEPPPSEHVTSESEGGDEQDSKEQDPIMVDGQNDEQGRENLDVELYPLQNEEDESSYDKPTSPPSEPLQDPISTPDHDDTPVYDDPSDENDGEGEWITPSNVGLHKSRELHLLPGEDVKKGKGNKVKQISVGCMTADFAMQNVLLQMGLSLVGVEGKRIERVKTWVLRCHACFKICKDNSRKFCPSCGNPTLLRASVTLSSPTATSSTPTLQVHLKKNFQYKTRGTVYSIPAPKSGSAKTGPGEGLILREDQTAWVRAKKHADGKREREEKRMLNGATSAKGNSAGVVVGSWMDPDWVPEMLSVGAGGKGRSVRGQGMDGDMPVIGYGKKNPNERKRRK